MTKPIARRAAGVLAAAAVMGALSLAGCSALMATPGPKSVAGLSPDGTVTLGEHFVAGVGEGGGTLTYQGQDYPFRLIGSVVGPGGGVQQIHVSGEVYSLNNLADFGGAYTQGTGPAGLDTSKVGDLWLRNNAGVIMHLTGTSSGVMLSLGRDEIYIRMSK